MAETSNQPVVEPVKMPTIKLERKSLSAVNAWAIALSLFLGYSAIFSAIAGFTKKWTFSIPFFGRFMGSNVAAPTLLLTVLFAVAFGIFGLVTIGKVTDAEAMKKSWSNISKLFLGFVIVYAIDMIGIALYSLMSLGRGKSFDQGELWLNSFLPTLISAIGACAMWFIGKQIAAGKTSILRIVSIAAAGIAIIAFILVFVQLLVKFYGKSSKYDYDDYDDYDYSKVLDLFK